MMNIFQNTAQLKYRSLSFLFFHSNTRLRHQITLFITLDSGNISQNMDQAKDQIKSSLLSFNTRSMYKSHVIYNTGTDEHLTTAKTVLNYFCSVALT